MFEKLQEKALMRAITRIDKTLRQCDFNMLRHHCMKMKWQALQAEDNFTYDLIKDYEELIDVVERIIKKEQEVEECQ